MPEQVTSKHAIVIQDTQNEDEYTVEFEGTGEDAEALINFLDDQDEVNAWFDGEEEEENAS